ncbi:MAG: site-specific integrase [Lachnospiraceae bacterium]|nr:site-specific integrase [Lachnospiraceae bacterium]
MADERRERGDGSIRKRDNGSWEGRYSYIDDDTGKRKTKSVYAPTKNEVKRKLKELINYIDNAPDDSEYIKQNDVTFGGWLDTWMKDYKKNSVRPATYTTYHYCIETHIRPELGDIKLQRLRPDHIQKLLNDMTRGNKKKAPLASWTVLKVKNIISGALEQAIRNQIIPYNPARATIPPKLEQKEIRILTDEEQKQFLEATVGHRYEALFKLALATGMRRGELLALTWDCIDWKSNSIAVKGSVSRVKDPDTGESELHYSEPKTKSSRRQVPILPSIVPVLRAHMERQEAEKAKAGSVWNERTLLFCTNIGTAIEPNKVFSVLNKITESADLPRITFHALRYTFATRMLEAEVPAKVVQDVLGHADVTLTLNTYSHVIGTTAHEQMSKINDLFQDGEIEEIKPAAKLSIKQKITEAKKNQKSAERKTGKEDKIKENQER